LTVIEERSLPKVDKSIRIRTVYNRETPLPVSE
jgi:hypothetical protein